MGMTDKQFNAFVRQVLDRIQEIIDITTDEKAKKGLEKIAASLRITLEED